MSKTAFKSVDDYIARHPENVQTALQRVRAAIRKAVPGAEEAISYQIPVFKLHGTYVVYFAGWKKHYSLYPVSARVAAEMGDELAPYELSKGTIRFPLSDPVPVKLIGRIAKFLAKEAKARTQAKGATSKKWRPGRQAGGVSPINKAWHERHRMPKGATAMERLTWHREHQKHCGCRPMPAGLQALAGVSNP